MTRLLYDDDLSQSVSHWQNYNVLMNWTAADALQTWWKEYEGYNGGYSLIGVSVVVACFLGCAD